MTEQDKQLLLVDLCSRLPYGVKVLIPECRQDAATLIGVDDTCFIVKYGESTIYCPFHISIKPYLRPMSSMTEEEKKDALEKDIAFIDNGTHDGIRYGGETIQFIYGIDTFDWLNAHHFDVRNLIGRGLAISTEEYNPYEK